MLIRSGSGSRISKYSCEPERPGGQRLDGPLKHVLCADRCTLDDSGRSLVEVPMELISCPRCHTRVIPKSNGECPACGRAMDKAADVPVEVPLRWSEDPSRGQSVSRRGSGGWLARRSNRVAAEIGPTDPSNHPVAGCDESVCGGFLDPARRRIALVSFAPGNSGDRAQCRESALSDLGDRTRDRITALDRPPCLARQRLDPNAGPSDRRPDDPLRPRRVLGTDPDTRRRPLVQGSPGRG